jgi:hypothetical protein
MATGGCKRFSGERTAQAEIDRPTKLHSETGRSVEGSLAVPLDVHGLLLGDRFSSGHATLAALGVTTTQLSSPVSLATYPSACQSLHQCSPLTR